MLVSDAMTSSEDHNRMRWASRRGLLELDLLLGPFVETEFPELDPSLRHDYRELMACDDQDILNWVMNRAIPTKPRLIAIVAKIRDHNAAKLNR
jgi:antitoxin CptB